MSKDRLQHLAGITEGQRPGKGSGYRDTEAFLVDLMTQLRSVQRDFNSHELSAEEALREYDRVIRSFDDAQVRPRR